MVQAPKWIENLPDDEANKQLLLKMIELGTAPIDTPREINFAIKSIADVESAEHLSGYFQSLGWRTTISRDENSENGLWLEAQKEGYVISQNQLYEDEKLFVEAAAKQDAVYDGWYAEVI